MSFEKLQASVLRCDEFAVAEQLSDWTEKQRAEIREKYRVLRATLARMVTINSSVSLDDVLHHVESKKNELEDIGFQTCSVNSFDMAALLDAMDLGLLQADEICKPRNFRSIEAIAAKILLDRDPPWLSEKLAEWTSDHHFYIPLPIWMSCCAAGKVAWSDDGALPQILIYDLADCFKQHPDVSRQAIRTHAPLRDALERYTVGDFSGVKNPCPAFPEKNWKPTIAWMAKDKLLDRAKVVPQLIALINPPTDREEYFAKLHSVYAVLLSAIKPTAKELTSHAGEIAQMFSHPDPSVIGSGLDWLQTLLKDGKCDVAPVIANLDAAMKLKPKTSPLKTLKLLPLICQHLGTHDRAIELALLGLDHPQADVQNLSATWLVEHADNYSERTQAAIATRISSLLPTAKKILQQLGSATRVKPDDSSVTKATSTTVVDLVKDPSLAQHTTTTSQAIQPINDVGTLLNRLTAATKAIESADEVDQLIAGLVRFSRDEDGSATEAKKDSKSIAKLRKAMDRDPRTAPCHGLFEEGISRGMRALIHAWLGESPEGFSHPYLTDELPYRLAIRLHDGKQTVLLSTPTHQGGWIDPQIWVQRLTRVDADLDKLDRFDLELSLLRLSTSGRRQAAENVSALPAPLRGVAECAIGEHFDVASLTSVDPAWTEVWIAAMRCRDPLGVLPIAGTPLANVHGYDTHLPTDYAFSMQEGTPDPYETLIEISAGTLAANMTNAEKESLMQEIKEQADLGWRLNGLADDFEVLFDSFLKDAIANQPPTDMIISRLHQYPEIWSEESWSHKDWYNEYLATFWPAKLDWYFALATYALMQRVDSPKAACDQPGGFLRPLMQADREVTPMAARAIWIATASKDQNSINAAMSAWSKLIDDGRLDQRQVCVALSEVDQHRWMVHKRVAMVLADVAETSPGHQIAIAKLIESMLASFDSPPRDLAALLEVLLQINSVLERSVGDETKVILASYKTGKSKKLAAALLNI